MNEKNGRDEERLFYVWFDTEYTDLDIEGASLMQVAALVTDGALRPLAAARGEPYVRLPIRLPAAAAVSSWVEEHLKDLVDLCRSGEAATMEEADRRLVALVDSVAGEPAPRERDRPLLAGNSIHVDWWFVVRFLPQFRSRLNYRLLDVSSFKTEWKQINRDLIFDKESPEMIRHYFPEAHLPPTQGRHDAWYDLQASIAELAFYRRHLLAGPTLRVNSDP